MRILVTGVTGFAGSWLAETLLTRSDGSVVGLARTDQWPASCRHLEKRVRLFPCELPDGPTIDDILRTVQPEQIYHLAGFPHVGHSFKDPDAAWLANLTGTRCLCAAVKRWGGSPRILFVSSGHVYGDPEWPDEEFTEDRPLKPTSPYGASKAAAELYCYQVGRSDGLDIVRVRPFNHFGPRQSTDFAIGSFARQLAEVRLGRRPPVLQTGDLSAERDLTDVRDIVTAYMALMEKGQPGEVYNLASGTRLVMQDVVNRLVALTGVAVEVQRREELTRPDETARLRVNTDRLRAATGWQPRHTLDDTLRDTLEYWSGRRMKIAVVGTGYVGLVTGTCFAESGDEVVCIDKDVQKVRLLEGGGLPIYEPGLTELVQRNRRDSRLRFTTDLPEGIGDAQLIFLAVGTPQGEDGAADLSALWAVGDAIAEASPVASAPGGKVIVIKSTVPVGTNRQLGERLAARTKVPLEIASNPEFLKEGAAVEDCMKPDRVVVGVRRPEVGRLLQTLYAPFLRTERPFLMMSPKESAEMTKYVANAMLATKISFINEMANLCEKMGADVNDVRRGIGHDVRIGFQFLFPGAGYGGSCFPKDVRALIAMVRQAGATSHIMQSVDQVNELQKQVLFAKIKSHFGSTLREKTLAIWGLSFKPRTDDVREAPALVLIDALLAEGVKVRVHDPEALPNVKALYGERIVCCDRPYGALEGANGLAIVTEWQEFRNPDFEVMRRLLKEPVIFDGRNLYEPTNLEQLGFVYYSIGRQDVCPNAK